MSYICIRFSTNQKMLRSKTHLNMRNFTKKLKHSLSVSRWKTGNFWNGTISRIAHDLGVGLLISSRVYQYLQWNRWVPRLLRRSLAAATIMKLTIMLLFTLLVWGKTGNFSYELYSFPCHLPTRIAVFYASFQKPSGSVMFRFSFQFHVIPLNSNPCVH